jgi:choline dehydrogenase-like flavoprotein
VIDPGQLDAFNALRKLPTPDQLSPKLSVNEEHDSLDLMSKPLIVIGSGPAGVSCAKALLAEGRHVLMIDGGSELEAANTQKLAKLRAMEPSSWPGEASEWLREGMRAQVDGIPLKLAYGSDFPYRSMIGAPKIEGEGVNTNFSLGKGGFSTVWGAAVMPYCQRDLIGWPVTAADLAPHYRAVLDFMPVAQGNDHLEETFPTFRTTEPLPLSTQARTLWSDMQNHASVLRTQGITFGRSRLAVNSSGEGALGPCARCGLCMYGCPYGLIYSTAQTVDSMQAHPNFRYLPGYIAQRLEERDTEVWVHTQKANGLAEIFCGERVFVGAGVLATASLMLRSLDTFDQAVTFKESHYFLLPMLRLRGVPGFERNNLHTLAQMFVEVMDETVSPNTIHLQAYTYNDLFEQLIAQKLGPVTRVFPTRAFLSRVFLFQGYLHSDHSPLTEGRLEYRNDTDVLRLTPTERSETTLILQKLVTKLAKIRKLTGMIPLKMVMRRGEPGRGYHSGGSFPMQERPNGFGSDLLGRPANLKRIYLVDASVFPSIPATTITYTVMANAHRIGTLVGRGDGVA